MTLRSYKLGRNNPRKKTGRPPKKRKSIITSISMPPHFYIAISKLAEAEFDNNFSATAVHLMEKGLDSKGIVIEVKV